MISFLTLFLGLLVGAHEVELAVGPEIAQVRLLLDGEERAVLDEEPWRTEIDLGETLAPHDLLAVAYDAEGEEIARARQWINRPRGRAESTLLLETDANGNPKALRLIWENLTELHPLDIRVTLNGRRLERDGAGLYPLPPIGDLEEVQIAEAEIEFEEGPMTRAELVFGGPEGDRLEVEMTAVPVIWEASDAKLGVEDLAGRLRLGEGRTLRTLGLESGRARIISIVEPSAYPILGSYARTIDNGIGMAARRRLQMRPGDSYLSQAPIPERRGDSDTPLDLFPISPAYQAEHGDLPFLISHATPGELPSGSQQLADAVAVAGVEAAAGDRPRAVLLILGYRWEDRSRFDEREVREFLTELRVPLIVWITGPPRSGIIPEDRLPLTRKTAWGRARDISSFNRFMLSVTDLRLRLDQQVIAWVAGSHLLRDVELARGTRQIELPQ